MFTSLFKYSFVALFACASAVPSNLVERHLHKARANDKAKAIYFITNAAQNAVVALKVNANGKVSAGSSTPTGGAGASGIDGMKNATAAPDSLFSQSALKAEGNLLVAVNPGSNTLSLMSISASDPTALTLIGQPVSTQGEFPVTATLSSKAGLACAANSGAKAGVVCFKMDAKTGLTPLPNTTMIPFDLNQSTPPVGPTNTVSHSLFNEDASALITTVKGDPTKNNTGFVSVLPIQNGCPAASDIRSSPAGTAVLFGSVIIPAAAATAGNNPASAPANAGASTFLATDAAFGAATLSLSSSTNKVSALSTAKIADQKATCWATISPHTNSAFVTDVAVNHLVEIDTATGSLLQSSNLTNGNAGNIDLVAAGKFMYLLSPGTTAGAGAKIVVVKVGKKGAAVKEVQNYEVQGAGGSSQGLTLGL